MTYISTFPHQKHSIFFIFLLFEEDNSKPTFLLLFIKIAPILRCLCYHMINPCVYYSIVKPNKDELYLCSQPKEISKGFNVHLAEE